jgi:hypothetical protein
MSTSTSRSVNIQSNLTSLLTQNDNGIASLRVYMKHAECGHMASKHDVYRLGHLLRVSLDYRNRGDEERCAEQLARAEKVMLRRIS